MHILRKGILALSGLFLCLFLTVHLGGNLILLLPATQAGPLYNNYSAALSANPLIKIIAYVNYAAFLFHIASGIIISLKNRRSRNVSYAVNRPSENSSWASRNMGLFGACLLLFTVIHMSNFWYKIKFGESDGDLYRMVSAVLSNPYLAFFYTVSMIPLGLHLAHGVASAFRSLGFYHRRYLVWIARLGIGYSVVLSTLFALIPLVMFWRSAS